MHKCLPDPKVIKFFSCSTQLSTKFQLLIKTKIPTKMFLALSLSDVVFIMLINVKIPTIVGIFMSPQPEGWGDILFLVRILPTSGVCVTSFPLSSEPVDGF